jgi:hypothetical protein
MDGVKLTGATREFTEPPKYPRKTVETMSNAEIKNKLCKDVRGGCRKCPVYDTCRYGPEANRRGLLK